MKSEISATVGWPFRRRRPMYFDTYFCFFSAFKDCSFFHLLKRINCVSRIYIKKTVPQLKPRDEKKAMAIGAHFTLNWFWEIVWRTNEWSRDSNLNTNCLFMESNMNYFVLLILQNGNRLKNLFAPLRFTRRNGESLFFFSLAPSFIFSNDFIEWEKKTQVEWRCNISSTNWRRRLSADKGDCNILFGS